MIRGTVKFFGDKDDKNTYQFEVENGCLYVIRNFMGDEKNKDRVPSGWPLENALGHPYLCIDGGTDWFVYPTKEAYDEIKQLVQYAD